VKILRVNDVLSAPVVTADGKVIGVLDVAEMVHFFCANVHNMLRFSTVQEVLQETSFVPLSADDSCVAAAALFASGKCHRLVRAAALL
jgi:CBS-domain-containing membrane protein